MNNFTGLQPLTSHNKSKKIFFVIFEQQNEEFSKLVICYLYICDFQMIKLV